MSEKAKFGCKNLDEFLTVYGDALGDKARRMLAPLHVPSRDAALDLSMLSRKPLGGPNGAQAHVITASVKAMNRQAGALPVAEMGTGKTFMSIATAHAYHAAKAPTPSKKRPKHLVSGEVMEAVMASGLRPSNAGAKVPAARTFTHEGGRYVRVGEGPDPVCLEVIEAGLVKGVYSPLDPEDGFAGAAYYMDSEGGREAMAKGLRRDAWVAVLAPGERSAKKNKGGRAVLARPAVFTTRGDVRYRALVVCPGHLPEKWKREILATIPTARVTILENHRELLEMSRRHALGRGEGRARRDELCGPDGPEWYIIGKDRMKLGAGWKPAYRRRSAPKFDSDGDVCGRHWLTPDRGWIDDEGCNRCTGCGRVVVKPSGEPGDEKWLKSSRRRCGKCGEQLWQEVPRPRRVSPARVINKRLRNFFDVGIFDEAHEYKGDDSLQADAMGAIATACKKKMALTGTLVGGYAWHVRTLLIRLGLGSTMIEDGYGWTQRAAFDRAFGRIEVKETISGADEAEGRAFGRSKQKVTRVENTRPGIMPTLFKHLIGSCIFLGLDEVADDLPPLEEEVVEVAMDHDLRGAYDVVERELMAVIKEMAVKGDKRLLGVMLNCLLCYPDYPFEWGPIGFYETDEDSLSGDRKRWRHVVTPKNFDPEEFREKESRLVGWCVEEVEQGRKAWVYSVYTDKRDCIARLEKALSRAGLKVSVMRSSVEPAKREAWIDTHGPKSNVCVSHPQLVMTGVDFFNKMTGHNFPSIAFYQTGYNPFVLGQAARRAWRIGQRRKCKVAYFYYENSMQHRAMSLMGKKMLAAQAVSGKFSAEGLAAMAGDDSTLEMALAKSLADKIGEDDGTRCWKKVQARGGRQEGGEVEAVGEIDDFLASMRARMAAMGVGG